MTKVTVSYQFPEDPRMNSTSEHSSDFNFPNLVSPERPLVEQLVRLGGSRLTMELTGFNLIIEVQRD